MKKILTFLVMLFAFVSILSAQDETRLAKFSYQAVVRDATNDFNLMMDTTVQIEVTIYGSINADLTQIELDPIIKKTNRNGMVAFEIAEREPGQFKEIDWSTASIKTVFKVNGTQVSVVESNVMAVPYALQSEVGDLEINTPKIVEYINNATDNDAREIINALSTTQNGALKQYLKDTIITMIKANYPVVKDLALDFLAKVTPADLENAYDTITPAVKQAVKDQALAYLKSSAGKDAAMDVLLSYISQAQVEDVDTILKAIKANHVAFDTILSIAKDSVKAYLASPAGINDMIDLADTLLSIVTAEQVNQAYNYIKTRQSAAYNFFLDKFKNYLNYYLTEVYFAVSNKQCPDVDICQLEAKVNQIINTDCEVFTNLSSVSGGYNTGWIVTATLQGLTTDQVSINDFGVYLQLNANAGFTTGPLTTNDEDNNGNFVSSFSKQNTTNGVEVTFNVQGPEAKPQIKVVWNGVCEKVAQ